MIAAAAASRFDQGYRSPLNLGVRSRLKLEEIQATLYDYEPSAVASNLA